MSSTTEINVWELASLAEVSSPDREDSPGARFLAGIAEDVRERAEYGWDEDAAHEVADGSVPVYTHERWRVFVDLAAYDEDVTEYGPIGDLTDAAGVALYIVARRLVEALAGESS